MATGIIDTATAQVDQARIDSIWLSLVNLQPNTDISDSKKVGEVYQQCIQDIIAAGNENDQYCEQDFEEAYSNFYERLEVFDQNLVAIKKEEKVSKYK